jgi:class 3 adenylate cyclase/tetratricopeptide (TPR) repeat protein
MLCPRCQHENPADARFCNGCGARAQLACAQCNQLNPSGSRFCNGCGAKLGDLAEAGPQPRFASPEAYTPKHLAEKILTSKSALEGERKQVTVLFADLKGSMELLADRDPEEARKILDPVLEHMMEAVHRYEGTVNQVMGDGVMALFGAPLAHEDHAVRACYAALRMQESVEKYAEEVRRSHGAVVKIRIGLNSGEVVVRAIGSDLHMDYTAVGQTTHLAARMEQLADPGTIVITSDTLALATGYVEVKSLGPVSVKGLAASVEIYEVTGAGPARTRLEAGVRRGLTRFVGRDAELEQLYRALQLASDGHGQVLAVVGEAGVGKSRLVYEAIHSRPPQEWLVLQAAAVSYGKATSYLPIIGLLRQYFKIEDRDDLREIREKVTRRSAALDEGARSTIPALLALLDVPVDDPTWPTLAPADRRQRTIDAVKRLLLRQAREQPLMVIVEDLHWIDGETQAVLDTLVDALGSSRLLLLANYRPEYHHAWGSKTSFGQIRLDALPAASADGLLNALLGDDPALGPLKQLLVKRGNPFFLEETVRTLVETKALVGERGRYRLMKPVQAIQMPATVQAILAARIDRLPAEDKSLLQVASVVGKDIPFALLRAVAELPDETLRRQLDRLQAAEFLEETAFFPNLEYAFKHALTHEVAYGALLHERRRHLHARIVDVSELLFRDRMDEQIERLAHHALQGALRDKAVDYLRRAGRKAAARSALPHARSWFEQALTVLQGLPETPSTLALAVEIRIELRPILALLGDVRGMLERLREAEILAERLNDDGRRGRVSALVVLASTLVGDLDEALVAGARALEIAGRLGDLRLRLLTTTFLVQTHYYRGDYGHAIELANNNLAALPSDWVYEQLGVSVPVSIYDRYWLVLSLSEFGQFAEAARREAEALQLAEPTHHTFAVGLAHWAASKLHLLKGDWTKARVRLEHGIATLRGANITLSLPRAVAASAWVLAQVGATTEALTRLREGEELLNHEVARGIADRHGEAYHSLGHASLLLGHLDEAQHLGGHALESSFAQPGFAAHARHLLGDIATYPERFNANSGEAHYRQALKLAEPRGMRPLIAHCHLGLGKLYRRTGKREEAKEHLATATTMYREMDMRFWLEQAEAK